MRTADTYNPIGKVKISHYGRHPKIDEFFTKFFGRGKLYEMAWKIVAHLRKRWPWFLRITTGPRLGVWTFHNGITNSGKAAMAGLLGNVGSVSPFTYVAYGTNSTSFSATQTALIAQSQRALATVSRVTTTVTNDTLRLVKAFSVTTTETAKEGGVFNASSGGTMVARSLFDPQRSMTSGDTLTVTHDIVF